MPEDIKDEIKKEVPMQEIALKGFIIGIVVIAIVLGLYYFVF